MPVWQKLQESVQPTWLETQSVPRVFLGDIDRLHLLAVGKSEQPFARAVERDLLGDELWAREGKGAAKLGAELLGNVGHALEIGGTAHIKPVPQLAHAHARLALGHAYRLELRGKLGAAEPQQWDVLIAPGRRGLRGGRGKHGHNGSSDLRSVGRHIMARGRRAKVVHARFPLIPARIGSRSSRDSRYLSSLSPLSSLSFPSSSSLPIMPSVAVTMSASGLLPQ